MQYAWAIPGAKVVYIGPPMIQELNFIGPFVKQAFAPSPLSPDKIYTLADVFEWPNTNQLAVTLIEQPGNYHVGLFKPVQKKDEEMFNEMLNDIPTDLHIERLDELARELDHVI